MFICVSKYMYDSGLKKNEVMEASSFHYSAK